MRSCCHNASKNKIVVLKDPRKQFSWVKGRALLSEPWTFRWRCTHGKFSSRARKWTQYCRASLTLLLSGLGALCQIMTDYCRMLIAQKFAFFLKRFNFYMWKQQVWCAYLIMHSFPLFTRICMCPYLKIAARKPLRDFVCHSDPSTRTQRHICWRLTLKQTHECLFYVFIQRTRNTMESSKWIIRNMYFSFHSRLQLRLHLSSVNSVISRGRLCGLWRALLNPAKVCIVVLWMQLVCCFLFLWGVHILNEITSFTDLGIVPVEFLICVHTK